MQDPDKDLNLSTSIAHDSMNEYNLNVQSDTLLVAKQEEVKKSIKLQDIISEFETEDINEINELKNNKDDFDNNIMNDKLENFNIQNLNINNEEKVIRNKPIADIINTNKNKIDRKDPDPRPKYNYKLKYEFNKQYKIDKKDNTDIPPELVKIAENIKLNVPDLHISIPKEDKIFIPADYRKDLDNINIYYDDIISTFNDNINDIVSPIITFFNPKYYPNLAVLQPPIADNKPEIKKIPANYKLFAYKLLAGGLTLDKINQQYIKKLPAKIAIPTNNIFQARHSLPFAISSRNQVETLDAMKKFQEKSQGA